MTLEYSKALHNLISCLIISESRFDQTLLIIPQTCRVGCDFQLNFITKPDDRQAFKQSEFMQAWQVFGSLYSGLCSRQIICCKSRLMAAQCRAALGPILTNSLIIQTNCHLYRHSTMSDAKAGEEWKKLEIDTFHSLFSFSSFQCKA